MWTEANNSLSKTYVFKDFLQAIAWMEHCVPTIEALQHHPEWTNVYNKVSIVLRTHDAGNIVTDKDRKLAQLLDQLYQQYINT